MQNMSSTGQPTVKPKAKGWQIALLILLAPLLLLAVVLWFVFFVISSIFLHVAVWSWWCIRGRDILFVYSDSPIWHDYIEQQVLPHLGERAVVLNWSQRTRWRLSLARLVFYHFAGWRAFNPMAVVFRPCRRTRTFRFLEPFKDFKHGRTEALNRMESEFFGLIGVRRHDPSV
jgi:hypothetical protein